MGLAHLYNALRQNEYLEMPWPRMESLLEIHDQDYIFFGGAPTTLKSALSKIRLSKGVSAISLTTAATRAQSVRVNKPP